jgi:hypothetical protein
MEQRQPEAVTQHHLVAFGAIVREFARFERLIEMAIAHLLKADFTHTSIVLSGLMYQPKCDALLALVGVVMEDADGAEITKRVNAFNQYSSLRNVIAHQMWNAGKRDESIKPVSVRSQGGKAKFRGLDESERDYMINELFSINESVKQRYEEMLSTLIRIGAVEKI